MTDRPNPIDPEPALLSDEEGLRQLRLLYNYRDTDESQFTRWQMVCAIHHGLCLAAEANRRASEHAIERCNVFVENERKKVDRLREALKECSDRLERAAVLTGTDPEYASEAVSRYRDTLANLEPTP